ncbi:MAG: carbohydrate ABC transporter permease [Chloroflexota bacterium]
MMGQAATQAPSSPQSSAFSAARARKIGYQTLVYFGALLLTAYCVVPLAWMVLTSIKPPQEVITYPPAILPKAPTIRNFVLLFQESLILTFLWNSVVAAVGSTVLSIILGTMAAYSLTRYRYPGRGKLATMILLGYMFPPIVLIIPFFVWFKAIGLTDSYIGLTITYVALGLPFATWLLWAFFQSIPLELEEAAWIDGATRPRAIIHVVLPLSLPGVIATSIFTFIVAWNEYLFALILMNTDRMKTLPVGLADLLNRPMTDWGVIMAAGVVITVPALLFFIMTQNYLVKGWGAGAVKG